ncbi:LOW QUALITY PROTEIN: hypothetical protein CFOL_v3_10984, partial [Cephalotus follicularis]
SARTTFSMVSFLAGSVKRGKSKREMLSISKKQIPPLLQLKHAPTVCLLRNQKGGPGGQSMMGGGAVNAVGGDRERARALQFVAQMVSYEVTIGLILIVRLVSAFGFVKAIARMF